MWIQPSVTGGKALVPIKFEKFIHLRYILYSVHSGTYVIYLK